jgi:hypothetical protein
MANTSEEIVSVIEKLKGIGFDVLSIGYANDPDVPRLTERGPSFDLVIAEKTAR